jgi:hypothetical protein
MALIHTCKEIHRLVSEGLDRDLSMVERMGLRVHLAYCDACTNFNGQMGLIRRAMRKMEIPDEPKKGPENP